MINFRIVSIPHVAGLHTTTWTPADWPTVNHILNPWADPLVERLNLLIFNLKRQVWARSPELQDHFHHQYGILHQAVIRAEFEYYLDELCRYMNILNAYVWDHYLKADIDSFMDSKIDASWASHSFPPDSLPDSYNFPAIYTDNLDSFEPKSAQFYSRRIRAQKDYKPDRPLPDMTHSRIQFTYATNPLESLVHDSFNHLLFEFAQSEDSNLLTGIAAKSRLVLSNGGIPVPNRCTILGWLALCAHDLMSIPNEPGMHMLTYTLPCMPMTQEHVLRAPIPGEDSGADHSLGYKSAAHDRDVYGRIKHGLWESSSVLVDLARRDSNNGVGDLIARRIVQDGRESARHTVDAALQMLPRRLKLKTNQLHEILGPLGDPHMAAYAPMPLFPARAGWPAPFDVGFRSLSRWHRVHLRFDDDEVGTLAATEWKQTFEREVVEYLIREQSDLIAVTFEAALIRQRSRPAPPPKAPRGRKPIHDFGDFGQLVMGDSN